MGSASDPKHVVTGYPAAPYPYPAAPPHATAYYAAPPPAGAASYYAPAYGNPPRNHILFRRLIAVAVGAFLLVGAATLIIWLVLRPRIPEFSVSSAVVSSFNLSSPAQQISSDFDLILSVYNPNEKMSVYYEHVGAAVLYGSDIIAETSLPPFYQDKGNTTTVRARLAAVAEYVEGDAVKGITADRADGDGAVTFHVRVNGWIMFRAGAWRTRRHVMMVFCKDVSIGFKNVTAGFGSLIGPPKRCQVSL